MYSLDREPLAISDDANGQTHRLSPYGAQKISDSPSTNPLIFILSFREIRWSNSTKEAFPLLLDVRLVHRSPRYSRNVHDCNTTAKRFRSTA